MEINIATLEFYTLMVTDPKIGLVYFFIYLIKSIIFYFIKNIYCLRKYAKLVLLSTVFCFKYKKGLRLSSK